MGGSVYKLGVLPWLAPQGTINQQGSRPDGGQEEAFCRFCHAKAVPEWVLGKEGVKAQELGGCPLRRIHSSLQKAIPAELAVDVGCGSGQGTHFLGEHFKKVVGTDISEAQIQEARDTPCMPNISYL